MKKQSSARLRRKALSVKKIKKESRFMKSKKIVPAKSRKAKAVGASRVRIISEKYIFSRIKVMPELSANSLERIASIPNTILYGVTNEMLGYDELEILRDTVNTSVAEEQKMPKAESMAEPVKAVLDSEISDIPSDFQKKVLNNLKETSLQTTKILHTQVIRSASVAKDLTFIRLMFASFWPVMKLYGWLYWTLKLRYIQRKKRIHDRALYHRANMKNVVDVFAPPKTTSSYSMMPFLRRTLVMSSATVFVLFLPLAGYWWYQKVLTVKENVLSRSRSAVESLREGGNSIRNFDLALAAKNFEKSKVYFAQASKEFNSLDRFTRGIIRTLPKTGDNLKTAFLLLEAGKAIAEAGEKLSSAAHTLFFEVSGTGENTLESFFSKLSALGESIDFTIPKIAQAKIRIENIDTDTVPLANRETLEDVLQALPALEEDLVDVSTVINTVLEALGYDHSQRYLLLFQNNNELRATGGFLGSYALVDIDRGKIENIEIPAGGTYDLQGALLALVESPKPFHLVNTRWEFQDANWWPDFPFSAQKIAWFYEQSQGPSVDGIIAVTASLMEKIVDIVGPIEMPEYKRVITAQNFIDETQKIVELEYDRAENRPKQFIADLAPEILERVMKLDQIGIERLTGVLHKGLKEKDVMLYSSRETIQDLIAGLDWGGEQKEVGGGDYLSVIHTNIAGGKADAVTSNAVRHTAQILEDGKILNTVEITRTHLGQKGDLFSGVQNNSYVRVYVPQGSVYVWSEGFIRPDESLFETPLAGYGKDDDLESREGRRVFDPETLTEIYVEEDKTVFANWMMVKPGETVTAAIRYMLPFTLKDVTHVYTLTVQKQAGVEKTDFSSRIVVSEYLDIRETYPKLESSSRKFFLDVDGNPVFYDSLESDTFYGVVFTEGIR